MGRIRYNPQDLCQLVEDYNPFVLKDEKGRILLFNTYEKAYYELLKRVYKAGPILFDAVLFCKKQLNMPFSDARKFVSSWTRYIKSDEGIFLIDWKDGGRERDIMLETIVRGMHMVSETRFNSDMFKSALTNFKSIINANN